MRLAAKLTAAVAVVLIVAMGLFDLHLVRQTISIYDADLDRAGRIGRALTRMVETVWRRRGDDITRALVQRSSAGLRGANVHLEWTALEGAGGRVPADVRDDLVEGRVVHRVDEEVGRQIWYVPMRARGGRVAALVYTESYQDVLQLIRTTHRDIALTTLFMLLGVTAATLLLGYWFVGRPIARLRGQARRLGDGATAAPLALPQHDEIGTLANEFDRMAMRLAEETERRERAVEQLRHTDRLTTVGQLASGVAHELGTPLNVVSGHAELIADGDLDAPAIRKSARIIIDQTTAMATLIRRLLSLARRTPADRHTVDLRDVALRTADTLQPLARTQGVTLTVEGPAGVALALAEPAHLQQALTNVVVNAIQAMPEGGPVRIAVGLDDATPPTEAGRAGSYARVTVVDQGPGVPEERVPHLFEPFFTTKSVGEGTGLGLPVSEGIVRDHGGWIEVRNERAGGARFTIWLPPATPRAQAATA